MSPLHAVLKLLSDEERRQAGDRNAVRKLTPGEEYLDLEAPLLGVQRLNEGSSPLGRILPRRAVSGRTWQQILTAVGTKAEP